MDVGVGEFEGVVVGIVGYDADMLFVGTGLDALDECALISIDDVDFVPLEKEVDQWNTLAGYNISGNICWLHAVAIYTDKEVCPFERWDHIAFAFILHYRNITDQGTSHSINGEKGDSTIGGRGRCCYRVILVCIFP